MRPMKAFVASLSVMMSLSAFAEENTPPKVTVVPFAALSGDVPQRAGQKAAAMLSNELKNLDTVQYVAPPKGTEKASTDKQVEALAHARSLVDEAKDQRQK